MKKSLRIIIFILVLLFVIFYWLIYSKTGFLQTSKIDNRDLRYWQFDDNKIILNAKEFTLKGSENFCWILVHGYTSTPDEMREIAGRIYLDLNETIFVTRLEGHGEVPSKILNLTLYDWYEQVSKEYDLLDEKCENINLMGFSFGGTLVTKLAENKDVNNVYLLSPYIFAKFNWYNIFKLETYLEVFSDILVYTNKGKIAQINSEEGLKKHIAYWSMPLLPVKNSKMFFEEVKNDLDKINAPVLLQQSKNDKTSDVKSSIYIYNNINSTNKKLVIFEKSNHVIMEDYDKEEVIENILNFERETRR